MGADIHSFAEIKVDNKWIRVEDKIFGDKDTSEPFAWRTYGVFGFLANVRNYSCIPTLLPENRGLPTDSEYLNSISPYSYKYNPMSGLEIPENERDTIRNDIEDVGYHSHSYIYLKELLDFDYKQTFEDRRTMKQTSPNSWNGVHIVDEGEGTLIKYEDFLCNSYFKDLAILSTLGNPEDVRIVFWFDN